MFWWLFADVNEDRKGVDDHRFRYIPIYVSILMIVFMILAVIVALNMLISMMSYSFENIMVSYFSGSRRQSGKKHCFCFGTGVLIAWGSHGFREERRGEQSSSTKYQGGTKENSLPISCQ